MFTGIVEEVGVVVSMESGRLTVSAAQVLEGTREGDSISVNGACLTVTSLSRGRFSADVVPETLKRTNLGLLRGGERVNLERAMPAGGRFGGHMVQGHVEGTGEVVRFEQDGAGGLVARYRVSPELARYIVPKGFIAVDGASLTVVELRAKEFSVALIPFTRDHTNLGDRAPGDQVNLETDVVARYVERLLQT